MKFTAQLPSLAVALLIAGCATAPPAPPAPPAAPVPPVAPAAAPAPAPAPATAAAAAQADTARRAEFDAALARWHGASLSELQSKLGKASKVTRGSDGRTTYAYTRAVPANPSTGVSRFSCTVRYFVDDKTQRVQSHQIDGC